MKLAKGIDPKGTSFHIASMGEGGAITWHTYKVLRVTWVKNFVPSVDAIVHLEYDFSKRSGNACAPLLQMPFEDFVSRVAMENPRIMPTGKKDVFWI